MRTATIVRMGITWLAGWQLAATGVNPARAAAEPANRWAVQDKALIGPDRPVAVVWSPEIGRFMCLGWISSMYDRRAPYTYDELAFDPESGQWENWYPEGKDWGPKFGPCQPPSWKSDAFKDREGNVRPRWAGFYWLLGAGRNCAYDSGSGNFLFYINGRTFSYDPAARKWNDLAAAGDPQNSTPLKSKLLWGSICYDEANKQVVLFGGGNADTERGDSGTWIYTPASNTWLQLKLERQPPPRANSQLAYDPVNKKVLLFGGDQLDQVVSDTWAFDGKQWEEKRPALAPAPRAGHALLWLPKAKKMLLLGGYTVSSAAGYCEPPYRSLPLEAWTYDEKADKWELVKRFEPVKDNPIIPRNGFLMAAVDSDDQVAVVDAKRKLWLCNLDASAPDAGGASKYGVKPGAVERRTGVYDPEWYNKDIPAADPAKVEAELKALPVNKWTLRPTPKRPGPNMDWGSAVYSPELDLIMRFTGGHSAYCGTAPQVYDVKTDRYSIPFAPEMPIEWCFANDCVGNNWSFKGNPWLSHTYKSTGYDPNLKCLVFGPRNHTFFFDPKDGRWTRSTHPNPYRPDCHVVTLVPTPSGLVAWAYHHSGGGVGLWRLKAEDRSWQPLPIKGSLFGPVCDNGGMGYDSKRDAMVCFVREGKGGCKVASYSFASGEARSLSPDGSDKVQSNFREAVYLPEADLMMIGATGWFYDCGKNAWFRAALASDAPDITKHPSYNLGVMYDPGRKLVWAVNTGSQVFVLRFDAKSANLEAVK